MWRLSLRSVRHHAPLFAGTFVALTLGVTLIAVSAAALAATWSVPTPSGAGLPSVTLTDGEGTRHTLVTGAPDLGGIQTVLVMAGVVAAFVTVFVIAGTCALGVALRRQDMGLLRLIGAGGPQVRRMVVGECLAVAVPAAALGCLLAAAATPWAVDALNGTGLAPVDLHPGPLGGPLLFAAGGGLAIAVLGALAASRRASRVRPTEALREAALDSAGITGGRAALGVLMLLAGTAMVALAPGAGAEGAVPLALFGSLALTLAASALGPLYLPRLARLVAAPLKRTRTVSGRLALEAVGSARLRTASLVGPVLSIVAVVGVFTSVMATTGSTVEADDRARTTGQLVVEPASGAGDTLDAGVLARLRQAPGVRAVSAPAPVDLAVAGPYSAWQDEGAVADLPALTRTHRVDVVEGTVRALGPGTVAVSKEFADWYGYHAGGRLTYGLYGGRPASARIVAVLDGGSAVPHVVLPPSVTGAAAPERATVLLGAVPDGGTAAAARELARYLGTDRVTVTPTGDWFAHHASSQDRLNRLVLLVLAGPASAYALIAVASTSVMSYSRRGREVAGMRLVGVSREQVRRMALWEAGITTALAAALAAVPVAVGLVAYRSALAATYGTVAVSVPWGVLAGLVAACLAVAGGTGLIAAQRLLAQREVAAVTARQ
ncbi:ABC transporter permease [Streptomyces mashuensis]|uniref:ABC transporter permease n=1 Tax=Streptomyces mashuensis TaxID=33904 RepID=A0A919ATS4_9ACTN|nr:FtsX-like permease family protein [Streptomyces mashuensis]GHF24677.1 ABC transporter permease [Streptomyces mashuensis]